MREFRVTITLLLVLALHIDAEAQEIVVKDTAQQSVSSYVASNYAAIVSQTPTQEAKHSLEQAQIPSLRYKNTLSVGYGLLFGAVYIPLFDMYTKEYNDIAYNTSLSNQLADSRYYWSTERAFTGITIEYSRRIKSWFAIGAKGVVSFNTRAKRHIGTNELLYRDNTLLAAALLNMRFDWFCRKTVTMYTSIGIGLMTHTDYYETYVLPMYDAAWVGITVGRRLYGYAEFGGGIGGLFRVGMGYRF